MSRTAFQEGLDQLEGQVQKEGDLVARALRDAIDAVITQDPDAADQVIAFDDEIDESYVGVEREVERVLALQGPVAADLRLVLAILHINHSLERMGDQCVNIAKLSKLIADCPLEPEVTGLFSNMGGRAEEMLRIALDSFANRDAERARRLCELDDVIDQGNRHVTSVAIALGSDAREREVGLRLSMIARCFERIGDNAVDIGEQTSFLVSGEIQEFEDASHPTIDG